MKSDPEFKASLSHERSSRSISATERVLDSKQQQTIDLGTGLLPKYLGGGEQKEGHFNDILGYIVVSLDSMRPHLKILTTRC